MAKNTVTIAQTGNTQEVAFKKGMTVEDAFQTAGITVGSGYQVRVNSVSTKDFSTALRANDTILIVGAIKGASAS